MRKKTKVPFREFDSPHLLHGNAEFTFRSIRLKSLLELEIIPALSSLPCGTCGRSTRDIARETGIKLPDDDMAVDVIEAFSAISPETGPGGIGYVYVIIKALTIENIDITKSADIHHSNRLTAEIDKHVSKMLVGIICCDRCRNQDLFSSHLAH